MDKQDATARAERLVNKTMPDVIIATSAIDRKSSFTVDVTDWKKDFKKRIAAALLDVQRETREACAQEILDRSRQRHASPYAWMSRVALEDCAQAIRGETK